jgi:L-fucose isomerase-like protein
MEIIQLIFKRRILKMGKIYKPKLGVILASHVREPSNFSLSLIKELVNKLMEREIEVIFNNKYLTTQDEIRSEIKYLKAKETDLFMIVPGNWIEPPILSHPLESIRNENILLLGFPESLELIKQGHFLGSNSAFTVLRNSMGQMGFKFKAIQEFPLEDRILDSIIILLRASFVTNLLKQLKLGLIGYCSMGIYTTCFDQLKLRDVFGVEVDTSADSYILFKKMEEVEHGDIAKIDSYLKKNCIINEKIIKDKSLEKSIKMYIALKKMAYDCNWAGLSVKCQHEFSTYLKCTACLPLSMLTDGGIMCTDEGDIHALLTMVIMNNFSKKDSAIYFGDIYKLKEGGFLMTHCGLSPHSCASDRTKIKLNPQSPRISKDGVTTGGVVSSYKFKEGKVTIGRIENDRQGNYLFHVSKGKVKPTESVGNDWSTLVFEPNGNDKHFADNQLANHYVFVYEDIIDYLIELARILDLKLIYEQ